VEGEGGFARAVGAEQRHPFSSGDRERRTVEATVTVGVGEAQILDVDGWW
jgi:hypothetical protein